MSTTPVPADLQGSLYGLLCERNIAKEQDFCSFRPMRILVAASIIFIVSGAQQAYAFRCGDLITVYHKILSKNQAMENKYAGKERSVEEECQLARDEVLPFIKSSIEELSLYTHCTRVGSRAAATIKWLKDARATLEVDLKADGVKDDCFAPH